MAEYGFGMPLPTDNLAQLYKGKGLTNGFLMRSVDGRVPALKLPVGRMAIAATNAIYGGDGHGPIPFGNALWRDNSKIDTAPGTYNAEKPTKGEFVGVLNFNQGWQAGNPVENFGLPAYSKGEVIHSGLVGYKCAKVLGATAANYLSFLKGDESKNTYTVRTTYEEWVEMLKGATAGSQLGLFFEDATGLPVVAIYAASTAAAVAASAVITIKNPTSASITLPAGTYVLNDGCQKYSYTVAANTPIAAGSSTDTAAITASAAGIDFALSVGADMDKDVVLTAGLTAECKSFTQGTDAEGPTVTGCTFAGKAVVFERENGAIFFELGK